jgi:hypothetical protein
MSSQVTIEDDPKYGTVLSMKDVELADRLEDFFTEKHYVLFDPRFDQDTVFFYFGQASSVEKVRTLYEQFLSESSEQ